MTTPACKIMEGRETVFKSFVYQLTTGKPLKSTKLTLDYFTSGSIYMERVVET
jgi:hypothetical protein